MTVPIKPDKAKKLTKLLKENYHLNDKQWKYKRDGMTDIKEQIMKKCEECGGRGIFKIFGIKDICPTCKGKGEVPVMIEVECICVIKGKMLNGKGEFIVCDGCHGTKKITRPKTLGDLIEEEK